MNQIAQENWAINRAFRKVEDNFDPNSQQSTGECDQRVTEMLNTQTTAGDKIRAMIDGAYGEASVVVNDVLAANYPGASFTPIFGSAGEPLLDVIDIGDEYGEQRRDITCSNISGFVFSPEGYESKTKAKHLRYLFMSPESFVGLAGMFEADFAALFLPGLFGKIGLKAVSAGQPYGGSIKHFALIEKDKVEEAIGEAQGLAEDGGAYWYRPALVPLERFYERIGMEMPDGEIYYH
jgi:phage tail protein X